MVGVVDTRWPVSSNSTRIAVATRSLSSATRTCGGFATSPSVREVGNREVEPASLAERALEPDAPTVQLHELARDGEAEPRAVMLPRRAGVDLRELTEHQLVVL